MNAGRGTGTRRRLAAHDEQISQPVASPEAVPVLDTRRRTRPVAVAVGRQATSPKLLDEAKKRVIEEFWEASATADNGITARAVHALRSVIRSR